WDFTNDGVVDTDFSPANNVVSHVYGAGSFVARCVVRDSFPVGNPSMAEGFTPEIVVSSVNHVPVCNLSSIVLQEDEDLTLDLDDYCFDLDGDVLSYSIVSAPQHLIASLYGSGLYLNPLPNWNGNDSLTLSVSDGVNVVELDVSIIVVPVNDAPVALFSFEPLNPVVGEEVLFNASESFDVDGDVLTFVWDFGDGSSSEGVITQHVFNTSQCFEVSLTVSDGDLSNTTTKQVCVLTQNHGPVCNLNNITMLEDHDLTLNLNNYCYDPDGDVLTFQILTQPEHLNASLQNSELSLTPMQDWNGNDWLSLFVSDGVQSFSLYVPIYVIPVNDAPIVLDIPDQTIVQGQAFQTINLSLYVIDVDNSLSEISWTANGQQHLNVTISNNIASIAYENQWLGSETITFCAQDIEGLQDCDNATFTVLYNDLNITSVEATATPSNGVEPLQVLLTCNATGGNEPLSFAWDFTNDGVIDTEFSPANNVLTHTYYQGTYFARCIVKDNDNDSAQALTNQINVQAAQLEPPVARFNYTPSQPRVNELVIFDASQSYDPDGFIVQYSWNFGDNTTVTTSPSPVTSHVYTTPGDYVVTLTVLDNDGLTSSYQSVLHVTGALQVISIECFPRVVVNHEQSCSVHVNDWFNPVGNALVTIKDLSTNTTLSTCLTDPITGACSASFIARDVGNRTVFATAEKLGYEPDLDSEPRFTYQVLQQRYTIKRLKLYNCSAFNNCEDYEYFRGEELFAKFLVIDLLTDEPVSKDVITQVWLVSQPGGRVELHQFLEPRHGWFYYWLPSIPLTHEFKGDSQVFSFVFNDSQAGEAVVNMTIKNNPPMIKKLPRITLNVGEETFIDLSSYEQDLEDAGVNLSWSIVTLSQGIEANLSGKVLQVKALQQGLHNIKLKLEDLDLDFVIADLMITVVAQPNTAPVVEILNPQDNDTFIVNESFKLIGFAFDNEQGVLPDDAMLWYYRCVDCFSHSDDWRFIRAGNDFDFAISEQGVYQVKLVAFDNQNLTGMDVVTINIVKQQQQVLIADANGPYYGTVNKPILFNASQSVGALTYTWDFGDGNVITTTQPVIEHVYNHYGVYDVKLTVSNGVETDLDFTKAFVDVQSACNDGIDNDNDGLIDMEDPGCESLKDNSEYNIPLNEGKLQIKKVFIPVARPDDLVPVTVKVLNLGRDLKHLHVSVMIPEAGVIAKTSRFDLKQGAVVSKTVYVPTPSMPGEFVVKVTVSNGVVRHSAYRVLIVE
ncbi:PKD domain-containing protein, partial [Candidatus Woesearchaeota archaeon]|nr:PKD domain-containing protein [Candidatus Woesearchaeota archaeon]